MTWLKILLWLLPIGLTIFGIVLVVNRIRSHSSLFRIIIAIIEAIVFIWIGCMVPIVYTNNVEKTSSASMISAPASILILHMVRQLKLLVQMLSGIILLQMMLGIV